MHTAEEGYAAGPGLIALWFAVLAGPVAWFAHLMASYSLVYYACAAGSGWILPLVTVTALVLATAGGWVAWRSWNGVGRPEEPTGGGAEGRSRFLALTGIGSSAFFILIILASGLPSFFFHPCQ